MSNNNSQQEILLAFNSSFLSKVYAEKCNDGSPDLFIEPEKIEEACWNGMLEEVLPEVFTLNEPARQIYIWEVREYNSVMEVDLGEFPAAKDKFYCIDPYKFMANRPYGSNN
jgi:hypothetical protein